MKCDCTEQEKEEYGVYTDSEDNIRCDNCDGIRE